jgi:hypothetical protein
MMGKRKIEVRLERILEQLGMTPESSEGLAQHGKRIDDVQVGFIDEIETYDQATAFSDHSNWSDFSDRW